MVRGTSTNGDRMSGGGDRASAGAGTSTNGSGVGGALGTTNGENSAGPVEAGGESAAAGGGEKFWYSSNGSEDDGAPNEISESARKSENGDRGEVIGVAWVAGGVGRPEFAT